MTEPLILNPPESSRPVTVDSSPWPAERSEELRSQGVFARMRYWLYLFADMSARSFRPGAAQTILNAAA